MPRHEELTPEESHIDTNMQRRLDGLLHDIYEKYPNNKHRHEMVQDVVKIKKNSTECLVHKPVKK